MSNPHVSKPKVDRRRNPTPEDIKRAARVEREAQKRAQLRAEIEAVVSNSTATQDEAGALKRRFQSVQHWRGQ